MVFTRKPTTTDTEWQCGRRPSRPVGSSADAPSHPLCPLPPLLVAPLRNPTARGLQRSGERDTEREFMGRCLEPEGVHPSQDQSPCRGTSLCGGRVVFPGLFCTTMETGAGWRSPRKSVLSDSTRSGNVGRSWPASALAGEVKGWGGPQMLVCTMPDLSLALNGLQSSAQTQSIPVLPDKGLFREKGFLRAEV